MIVACVWTGTKYSRTYVDRLFSMVSRHLSDPWTPVCLTDHPDNLPETIRTVDTRQFSLNGWWAKMALFEPRWRRDEIVIYLDLDTVVMGSLLPMAAAAYEEGFAICESFVRRSGHPEWPCRYGSAFMVFGPNAVDGVWQRFMANRDDLIRRAGNYGDQKVIEELLPKAPFLQDLMPKGYFIDRREVIKHPDAPPPGCTLVAFAGPLRPENCKIGWVQDAWR